MAHSDDATKTWVSAIPVKNSDGNVVVWKCEYKYTLNTFSNIFFKRIVIETPSKAPASYTKAELLSLCDVSFWNNMFNKKYDGSTATAATTTDTSFDVSTLSDS
jgi:hypothetical protein